MIEQGMIWQARELADAALAVATRYGEMGSNGARRHAYCEGVEDVLRFLTGDAGIDTAPAELQAIYRMYLARMDDDGPDPADREPSPETEPTVKIHIDNGTFGQPPYGAPRGTLCGLAYGDGWTGQVITDREEAADATCPDCRPAYTLHYISADAPGDDTTWSVYREQYVTREDDAPIDGTQEHVSTHATEGEADAEARRLQQAANA